MGEQEDKKRPIGLISVDTQVVYNRLASTSIGDIVKYDELESLIGRDIRKAARYVLRSACRKSFSDDGFVFGVIPRVGIKRLADQEIIDSSTGIVSRIHRHALKGTRRLGVVDYAQLKDDVKLRYNLHASLIGMLAHVTTGKAVKKLEGKVKEASITLPVGRSLEAFK